MLVSVEIKQPRLISHEIFSKNSNISNYEYDTSTSRTDKQRDLLQHYCALRGVAR